MTKLCLITSLTGCFLWILTGCGQTGPLYLPDNPPVKSATTGQ